MNSANANLYVNVGQGVSTNLPANVASHDFLTYCRLGTDVEEIDNSLHQQQGGNARWWLLLTAVLRDRTLSFMCEPRVSFWSLLYFGDLAPFSFTRSPIDDASIGLVQCPQQPYHRI